MSKLFDQASQAHQRELDQAFAAGEQRGILKANDAYVAEAVELRVAQRAERDQAYRDGFEACALYATIFVAITLSWLFVFSHVGMAIVHTAFSS